MIQCTWLRQHRCADSDLPRHTDVVCGRSSGEEPQMIMWDPETYPDVEDLEDLRDLRPRSTSLPVIPCGNSLLLKVC